MRPPLMTRLRAWARDARGNAAVETALVLPVAVLLLSGTAQAGYMLFVYNNLLHVAQEASRSVAVQSSTAAEAKSWAEGKLTGYGSVTVAVSQTADEIETSISVPLTSIAIIDPLGVFSTGNLSAVATAKDQS